MDTDPYAADATMDFSLTSVAMIPYEGTVGYWAADTEPAVEPTAPAPTTSEVILGAAWLCGIAALLVACVAWPAEVAALAPIIGIALAAAIVRE